MLCAQYERLKTVIIILIGVGTGGARGAMAPLTSRDTLFPSYVTR